jgi:hypothetical protein
MTVEVDDSDWAVCLVDTAQQRQRNGMVTSKGNDTWKCLASPRDTGIAGAGIGLAHQQAVMALLDLLDSPGIVESVKRQFRNNQQPYLPQGILRSNWDITTIQNSQLIAERVRLQRHIVTTTESQFA